MTATEEDLLSSMQRQTLESEDGQSEVYEVRCPCTVNKDDGVMILCDGCGLWQHAICFRILEEAHVPVSHVCEICAKSQPHLLEKGGVTDETLQTMEDDVRKSTCLFRRAILLCENVDVVSPAIISKSLELEYTVARGLFNRLVKEGVLKNPGPKRGEKTVEHSVLTTTIHEKFFANVSPRVKVCEKANIELSSPETRKLKRCATRQTPRGDAEHTAGEADNEIWNVVSALS